MIISGFDGWFTQRSPQCQAVQRRCTQIQQAAGRDPFQTVAICNAAANACDKGVKTEFGALDPVFFMTTGVIQPWYGKDPRRALTTVAQTAQTATHPLAGSTERDFGVLAWLRGDRR